MLKEKTWVNLVKDNCEPLFYSKFRFWTKNGWGICQWKKKYPEDHHLPRFESDVFSFIGRSLSHLQFKIWILSKKGVHSYLLSDSLKSNPLNATGKDVDIANCQVLQYQPSVTSRLMCQYLMINYGIKWWNITLDSLMVNIIGLDDREYHLQCCGKE